MARILLVEDNDMNRDMLSRRLQRKGHEVLMAADGMQAILMAESEAPDLILLDMSLPVIDGWEAARRLKASPATARVPIVALTAHAMAGDREKALDAGCDDYDTKPVDFPQLTAKIDAILAEEALALRAPTPGRGAAPKRAPRARTSPSGAPAAPGRSAGGGPPRSSSLAVTTTTGMSAPALALAASSATNSKPSISGIIRSSRIRSGRLARERSRPTPPVVGLGHRPAVPLQRARAASRAWRRRPRRPAPAAPLPRGA